MILIIEQYIEALKYSCHFVYQTLPRLLALWLDFGAQAPPPPVLPRGRAGSVLPPVHCSTLQRINELIKSALISVPRYVFLTAFPQLISRIGIDNNEVMVVLIDVIAKTVQVRCIFFFFSLHDEPVHLIYLFVFSRVFLFLFDFALWCVRSFSTPCHFFWFFTVKFHFLLYHSISFCIFFFNFPQCSFPRHGLHCTPCIQTEPFFPSLFQFSLFF